MEGNEILPKENSTIPPKTRKSVHFSADTVVPREDNIALTIIRHMYTKELGYTQYHIQVTIFLNFFLLRDFLMLIYLIDNVPRGRMDDI